MAMLTILLLLSAAFALGDIIGHGPVKPCRSGWTEYESHCFMFIKTARTWAEAERHCISLGANLASVHSSEEAQFLQGVVFSETGEFTPTWIGGFEDPKEILEKGRLWFWSDGSKFDYQNWNQGEPNNSGGREPCIVMNFGGEHGWNDLACGNILPSVCFRRTF
ncbi:ladderlectin-like isoform X2 [Coregonus clupeaformis]|uniref:ladderlectin-like isoform X2 n=1 Tax=Coregonus clupeaformis TaxID=59861 RepID=UPI001BE0D9A3|nr:ladderlectin-like isoform X2 [Coregonus clupeaformis]